MKFSKHLLAGLVAVSASASSMAGVIFYEGFENIATLGVKGWSQQNLSTPVGSTGWFQGTAAFVAPSGPATSYIAANFNNSSPSAGSISNWLMTPVVDINKTVSMTFDLRLAGEGFLDTVQIYYSSNGASTAIGDFTLLDTYSSTVDTGWLSHTASLASFNGAATGRFAFRYVVADTTFDGNFVGIDSVNVVPEPASMALVALGLAGAAVSRRRKLAA